MSARTWKPASERDLTRAQPWGEQAFATTAVVSWDDMAGDGETEFAKRRGYSRFEAVRGQVERLLRAESARVLHSAPLSTPRVVHSHDRVRAATNQFHVFSRTRAGTAYRCNAITDWDTSNLALELDDHLVLDVGRKRREFEAERLHLVSDTMRREGGTDLERCFGDVAVLEAGELSIRKVAIHLQCLISSPTLPRREERTLSMSDPLANIPCSETTVTFLPVSYSTSALPSALEKGARTEVKISHISLIE